MERLRKLMKLIDEERGRLAASGREPATTLFISSRFSGRMKWMSLLLAAYRAARAAWLPVPLIFSPPLHQFTFLFNQRWIACRSRKKKINFTLFAWLLFHESIDFCLRSLFAAELLHWMEPLTHLIHFFSAAPLIKPSFLGRKRKRKTFSFWGRGSQPN